MGSESGDGSAHLRFQLAADGLAVPAGLTNRAAGEHVRSTVPGRLNRLMLARRADDSSIAGHNLQRPYALTARLVVPPPAPRQETP